MKKLKRYGWIIVSDNLKAFNKDVKLQKIIADSGLMSRRKAEEKIKDGKVLVNKKVAKIGQRASLLNDLITVEGKVLEPIQNNKKYIMLYKPRGVTCTTKDKHAKICVTDLVKDVEQRVYPIGRLDKDSEGLILLTNDGDFANKVMHPSKGLEKKYRVTVAGKITEQQLVGINLGVDIADARVMPKKVDVLLSTPQRTVLAVTLADGKNREIRRLCEKVGLAVKKLKRVSIGSLKLGMLQVGKYKEFTKNELEKLIKI